MKKNKENSKIKPNWIVIFTIIVIFLTGYGYFIRPLTIVTGDKVVYVETGSPQWWLDTQELEDMTRKQLANYSKASTEYKQAELTLELYSKEKEIVKKMTGLSKDSKKYKELDAELKKLVKSHHEKMKSIQK